jgi:hypothetical protein
VTDVPGAVVLLGAVGLVHVAAEAVDERIHVGSHLRRWEHGAHVVLALLACAVLGLALAPRVPGLVVAVPAVVSLAVFAIEERRGIHRDRAGRLERGLHLLLLGTGTTFVLLLVHAREQDPSGRALRWLIAALLAGALVRFVVVVAGAASAFRRG